MADNPTWDNVKAIMEIVAPDKDALISEVQWQYTTFEQQDGSGAVVSKHTVVTGASVQIDLV